MKRFVLFFIVLAGVLIACSSGDDVAENSDSAEACKPTSVNPNGDSELALLMREMANWTDTCRAELISGRKLTPKPGSLANLHTAKRTDETIDVSRFNSLATLYEEAVSNFEVADSTAKVKAFNNMVAACGGCHQNFCQGPLTRINKMYIEAN